MKKALFLIMALLIVLGLFAGCAKKPADVIVGDWKGEGKIEVPNAEPEVLEFTGTFAADGNVSFTPKDEEAAKGTYTIDDAGAITATVTIAPDDKEVEFAGKLDMEKVEVTLATTITPTEEEYAQIKAMFEAAKLAAEEAKTEFTEALPTLEELTSTITLTLTKVEVKEEKTE